MAGLPPPLPVPTPFQAKFANKFNDTSTDPTGGNPATIMSPFLYDINNAQNNTETQQIRNKLASSGAARHLLAAIVMTGGVARVYVSPFRWDDGLANNNPTLGGRFFAMEGELLNNQPHTVEIDARVFSLINNTVAVSTVANLVNAYANDTTLEMTGPHQANDAGTEPKKSRPLIALPHFLVPLFLVENGVSPRYFWTTIYPVITGMGMEGQCRALVEYFQIAATSQGQAGDPSVLNTNRPVPPARNEALIQHQQSLLEFHFPQLSSNVVQQQTNQVAGVLAQMAHNQQQQYEEGKREREAAKVTTVEKWLGKELFTKLLRLLRVSSEAELVAACPVYLEMAKAPKSQRMRTFQTKIDAVWTSRGDKYMTYVVAAAWFQNFLSMEWGRANEDSLLTGFIGNLFAFGEQNEEAQQALNLRAEYAQGGDRAISTDDAEKILKIIINPPRPDKSLDNLKRLDVVCTVVLPAAHPFRQYVSQYTRQFENFKPKWEGIQTREPCDQGGKDILHAQYVSLRLSRFWRDQAMSDITVALPSPNELMDSIEYQREWEPRLSRGLRQALKFDQFSRMFSQGPSSLGIGLDDATQVSDLTGTTGSASTASALNTILHQLRQQAVQQATSTGAGSGGGGGTGGSTENRSVDNTSFNATLFGEYKTRQVNGRVVRSKDVREAVRAGRLPALPTSKVQGNNQPMCLAWHTKGQCSQSCPLSADHVLYTEAEYQPLCGWCTANYPSE
jgi:hypothetical protein